MDNSCYTDNSNWNIYFAKKMSSSTSSVPREKAELIPPKFP